MDNSKRYISLTNLYRCLILFTGFPVGIFMIIKTNADSAYNFYFLVPLIFSLVVVTLKRISKNINFIGMMVLLAVMYFKYIVMPFVNCLSGYTLWRGITPNQVFIERGIWLTIYEMIAVLLTIYFFQNKFYNISAKEEIATPKRYGVYISVVAIAILLVFLFPSLKDRLMFVLFANSGSEVNQDIQINGLLSTIFDFGRLILILLVICYCKVKYDKRSNIIYVFISMLAVMAYLLFSSGDSRWSIAVPGLILTFLLTKVFMKHKKEILFCIGTVMIIGLVTITAVKMNYSYSINSNTLWADTLQMYFSGPKNIAFAIETKKTVNDLFGLFPINVVFNDFFRSVAGLSRLANTSASTIEFFNAHVYGNNISQDQIIPLMGQSFIYFGYIFTPFLTVLATIVMMFLDRKANKSPDIMQYYIFSYTAVWFARAMMLNATIIFAHFVNTLCLFLILKFINDKIVILAVNYSWRRNVIKGESHCIDGD